MATKDHPWYRARRYLHFDNPVGVRRAERVALRPKQVAGHAFYPFIEYSVASEKIKTDKKSGQIEKKYKTRPIAYAAHLDSQIYSYYCWTLSQQYEKELGLRGVESCVLAFRALSKSNVDFAAQAFDEIRMRGDCAAVALDVTGFFDNLDHHILKERWATLIGRKTLPSDHYAVFRSITRYSTVNKEKLYQLLGISPHNRRRDRIRICESEDFRKRIRAAGLVQVNTDGFGIPQGSPISALLSNIYMLDFDSEIQKLVRLVDGVYMRYCDDILVIAPAEFRNTIAGQVRDEIKKLKLDINTSKTKICTFSLIGEKQICDVPLQYLGFTFDGQKALIRSSALARYSELMKKGVRLEKKTMDKRNRRRRVGGLPEKALFKKKIYKRYSHFGSRNFVRYGYRSAEILKSDGIKRQLRPLWKRLQDEIDK